MIKFLSRLAYMFPAKFLNQGFAALFQKCFGKVPNKIENDLNFIIVYK
jgi:hypothetical protein